MEDWVEIAALRLDGAAATWANALLLEVSEGKRMPYTWEEFCRHMIACFEPVTENEEARWELRELRQNWKSSWLHSKIPRIEKQAPHHDGRRGILSVFGGAQPSFERVGGGPCKRKLGRGYCHGP